MKTSYMMPAVYVGDLHLSVTEAMLLERFCPAGPIHSEAGRRSKLYTYIYIKNLSKDVNDQLLKDIFSKFGPTSNAQVITDENGDSKGFGFVKFERHEDARRAVDEMNGKKLNGKQIHVGWAQTKEERQAKLNKDRVLTTDPLPAMDRVPAADPLPGVDSVRTEESAPVIKPAPHVDSYPVGGLAGDVRPAATQAQAVSELQQEKVTADGPTSPPIRKQLTIYMLESVPVDDQIQMAYDYMFPLVEELHPTMANKITRMLLEGENNFNIINMIRDPELLHARVDEMDSILKAREAGHKPETLKMLYNNNSNKKRRKKNRRKNQ